MRRRASVPSGHGSGPGQVLVWPGRARSLAEHPARLRGRSRPSRRGPVPARWQGRAGPCRWPATAMLLDCRHLDPPALRCRPGPSEAIVHRRAPHRWIAATVSRAKAAIRTPSPGAEPRSTALSRECSRRARSRAAGRRPRPPAGAERVAGRQARGDGAPGRDGHGIGGVGRRGARGAAALEEGDEAR